MVDPSLRLPAQTIIDLVTELSDLQDRYLDGAQIEIPIVTLLLDSGHMLSGIVVRATRSANLAPFAPDATLLIQHQDKLTMSYVPIVAIHGITVHYNEQNLHLLSAGKIKPSSSKVPSRLDLERYARNISEILDGMTIEIAWDEIPRSDVSFQSLELMLQDLKAIAIGIHADELGRTAFPARVDRVEVRMGSDAAVKLHDRVLTIFARIEAQDAIYLNKTELQRAIESAI
jgi:hypothetical protein